MSGHAKSAVQIQSESELFTGDTYKLSLGLAGSLPYACFFCNGFSYKLLKKIFTTFDSICLEPDPFCHR